MLSSEPQSLISLLGIPTLFLSGELKILGFTHQFGELFGLSQDDQGKLLENIGEQLGFPDLLDDIRLVVHRRIPVERELETEQGEWYLSRVLPCSDSIQKGLGVVVTLLNVSDRKRSEQELERAKIYAESIVETLHEPLLVLEPDLTIKTVNPAFYDHFQVGSDTTIGRKIYDLGDGQWDIPQLRNLLEDVLPESNVFCDYEVRHHFKGLGQRIMLLNARRLDHVQLILLGIRDITEKKVAEERIRDSEEKYRLLFETMSEGFALAEMIWDDQGNPSDYRYLEANKAWQQVGVSSDQIVGHLASELCTDSAPAWIEIFGEVVKSGRPASFQNFNASCEKWFETFAFRHSENRFAILFTNITERKRIERELRENEEQLRMADRKKDQFLATLAHELRNPLAPIRTGLDILREAQDDPTKVEHVCGTLDRQSRLLVALVNDLLDVSRLTHGKLTLRKRLTNLIEVLDAAIEASQSFIVDGQHELKVQLPDQPIILHADPTRLSQVFSNLLCNAAKYTPAGGRIWLRADLKDGQAIVTVRDTGIGIPTEMHTKIFDMFTQATAERSESGLGIGLTLVKSLLEMHEGKIQVESPGIGQGTTFTVYLPITTAGRDVGEKPTAPEKLSPARRKILVVDDNKAAAFMLNLLLKEYGNEVKLAHDGEEAVEVASQFTPEIIFMDIGMPRMDGYEAAARIREQSWGQNVFLVALTGWGQEDDKRKTREAGFDDHLIKPADRSVIERILIKACNTSLDQ